MQVECFVIADSQVSQRLSAGALVHQSTGRSQKPVVCSLRQPLSRRVQR